MFVFPYLCFAYTFNFTSYSVRMKDTMIGMQVTFEEAWKLISNEVRVSCNVHCVRYRARLMINFHLYSTLKYLNRQEYLVLITC
jgi:hypothetical protein